MARTELPNGVILPAEYSDDWYEDMTSNLTKLDDVIGSDSEKLNADGVYFLRMSSAALTDGGTGNFSDLNSSNKLKTGDYVLDSGRKLYQVVSVDSTNETFTVGNSLFKITAESDLAPVAESGDYGDLDNRPDLNPYDQHIVNTDIHVTTADKSKWNNGISQSYVLRYSSTAITDNSTIAYSTLDNTDNIKANDKIIDVDGKIFSIVSVDSDNSTVTVGSALIDLAVDANVMHLSGNETATGVKTFSVIGLTGYPSIRMYLNDDEWNVQPASEKQSEIRFTDKNAMLISYITFQHRTDANEPFRTCWRQQKMDGTSGYFSVNFNNLGEFYPENYNSIKLGKPNNRWLGVYAMNYYYGANDVEFSTKFVTSDTTQTITGAKTFSDNLTIYNSDDTQTPKGLAIRNAQWSLGESGGTTVSNINFLDKNSAIPASVMASKGLYGQSFLRFSVRTKDSQNNTYSEEIYYDIDTSGNVEFRSWHDNIISLGTSAYKWKDVQTKLINGLTPSSLSMPSDRSARVDISGYFTNTANGDTNTYTVPANGWIYLNLNNVVVAHCFAQTVDNLSHYGQTFARASAGQLHCLFPVRKDDVFVSQWYTTTTVTVTNAYFVPCLGNV